MSERRKRKGNMKKLMKAREYRCGESWIEARKAWLAYCESAWSSRCGFSVRSLRKHWFNLIQ